MILIYIALAIVFYSIDLLVKMFKGTTGPQVHEENKRLKEENARLREKK